MKTGLKLPAGVAVFVALALAGMTFMLGFGPAPSAEAQSNNADLRSLTLDDQDDNDVDILPGFTPGQIMYTASVAHSVTSVEATARASDPNAIISGAGETVNLISGANTVSITVRATDGTAEKVYTIIVTRMDPSRNAALKSLDIQHVRQDMRNVTFNLMPQFMADEMEYTAEVPSSVTTLTVNAMPADSNADVVITMDDTVGTGEGENQIALSNGENTITITVTAEDDTAKEVYEVVATKAATGANNADLKSLMLMDDNDDIGLNPRFTANNVRYTATVEFSVSDVDVEAMPADDYASVSEYALGGTDDDDGMDIVIVQGNNTITITVTAEDGSAEKVYTIIVTKGNPNNDANLKSLMLMDGDDEIELMPSFMTGTTSYKASVASSVIRVSVDAMTRDDKAESAITIGNEDAGTTSVANTNSNVDTEGKVVTLPGYSEAENTTVIVITSTAEDTAIRQAYSIAVTKDPPSKDANLKTLMLMVGDDEVDLMYTSAGGQMMTGFMPGIATYEATVLNTVMSVSVEAMTTHKYAEYEIKKGGMTYEDGMVPLDAGMTAIIVTVTAEDGTSTADNTTDGTMKAYRIEVTKSATTTDPLLVKFDTNDDEIFQRSEVIAGINRYLDDESGITRSDVIAMINRYLDQ